MKIVWVDSWRDIPLEGIIASDYAVADYGTKTIYAIKGKTTEADIEHEKYHMLKRHRDLPVLASTYVRQELEAHKYSYDNIGKPRHILRNLRALLNDITWREWKLDPEKSMMIIRDKLYSLDPPEEWEDDFRKLENEVSRILGRGYMEN